MSSAVHTNSSSSTASRQARIDAPYALEMMRTIAPSIDTVVNRLLQGANCSKTITAAEQLMAIQQTLAQAKVALKAAIPARILSEGSDHIHFVSAMQRPQGSWIKDTYTLIGALEEKIRQGYRDQIDPVALRNDIVTNDGRDATSLPRLVRAFAKSAFFTGLHLSAGGHCVSVGIKADLSAQSLRHLLTNNTNIV